MTLPSAQRVSLVSVLIPAYNAARWIRETLLSVLAQTWPRLEIIVVDDGSQDETVAIAREFEDARVRVISQPNAGPAVARNRAFRDSSGSYIQFLDADDLISPNKIETSVKLLESIRDPRAFVVTRWGRFHQSMKDVEQHDEPSFGDWDGFALMLHMLTARPAGMQPTGTWLIPRPLCEAAGPWSEAYLSPIDDGEYLFRLLSACSTMRFSPEGMLYYRSGIGGLSSLRSARAIEGLYKSYAAMTDLLRARENSTRTHHATALTFQRFIYENYPRIGKDLLQSAEEMVRKYGGSSGLEPEGSPRFQFLRRFLGWKNARRIETMWRRSASHE